MNVQTRQHADQPPSAAISEEEIRAGLERVAESDVLADSPKLKEFLRYVVNETLAGKADRLKGFTIALEVFNRDDVENAQTSTIVRVEAGRLRRRLVEYYGGTGSGDPIRIEIPKGGYVPVFSRNQLAEQDSAELPVRKSEQLRLGKWTIPSLVAIVVAIVAVGGFRWQFANDNPSQSANASPPVAFQKGTTLAVLPFTDATSNDSAGLMALGLTEDIITDLSKIPDLDVIALNSVLHFQNFESAYDRIRNKLGASHVLRGSVRGDDNSNRRVTAQLYEVESGKEIWAERFDRNASNLLEMQNELSTLVVAGISRRLQYPPLAEKSARAPVNNEARALFRQAMDMVNPPSDSGRMLAARLAFKRVTEIAPDYAGGYAGVAYTHVFAAFWTPKHSSEKDLGIAIELSDHALGLDPNFGLAYFNKAFAALKQGDHDKALSWSNQAVSVQPGDPYLNAYHAFILATAGNADAAIPYAEHALRLDPLNPRTPYLNILGVVNYHAGNYEASLAAFRRSRDRGGPITPGHRAYAAAAMVALGRTQEAFDSLPESMKDTPLAPLVKRVAGAFRDSSAVDDLVKKLDRLERYRLTIAKTEAR
jgi:adenylate cyclase